jgi:hypothetical protein
MATREAACHCGQLRLGVTGDPFAVSICHCLACQRRTGSAFGMQAGFKADQVQIAGRFNDYTRVSDEADRKAHVFHFCPDFGSQVFYTEPDEPDRIVVSVGRSPTRLSRRRRIRATTPAVTPGWDCPTRSSDSPLSHGPAVGGRSSAGVTSSRLLSHSAGSSRTTLTPIAISSTATATRHSTPLCATAARRSGRAQRVDRCRLDEAGDRPRQIAVRGDEDVRL